MKKGANISIKDNKNLTAFHYAVGQSNEYEIAKR